ncbi:hypothetical protein OPT61_g6667 [Boeremia exigua]|uniref:Uncharacterized protein n=1 Tax=Boeremia exigua TaxID=749465 RepID=A0ACC2I551_9PLEO|nr:hypothetical protein OPT61_g6667 [Boeremia exigua]
MAGLDGSAIAAILTGILALAGAIATAWMSGWNEQRTQARVNQKALAQYSVPLIIAAWDLTNWFYDILEEPNYNPERCAAYGDGWNSQFTSYLIGSYFAGVHIIREMTHFFAHINSKEVDQLKKLLWKIQDEFISMNYEGRESLEMRWFEGDILAAQEYMTEATHHSGKNMKDLETIGWLEFQKKHTPDSEPGAAKSAVYKVFEWYEDEFQRIVYRRYKYLYANKWPTRTNPQSYEKVLESLETEEEREKLKKEEELIRGEQLKYPHISVIVPDHRVRRLQHLLSDLVEVLDAFTTMKLNRPVRRCKMEAECDVSPSNNPLELVVENRIPCDCSSLECNPSQLDFEHRQLPVQRKKNHLPWRGSSGKPMRTEIRREDTSLEKRNIIEQSKV